MNDAETPPLNGSSLDFAEELYLAYVRDPSSVPDEWRRYFDEALGVESSPETPPGDGAAASDDAALLQQRVDKLVRNYRVRGHRVADVNPLGRDEDDARIPEIELSYYGLTDADLTRPVLDSNLPGARTLGDVVEGLRETYCRAIGVEYA